MGTILVPLYLRGWFYIPSHGRWVCRAVCGTLSTISLGSNYFRQEDAICLFSWSPADGKEIPVFNTYTRWTHCIWQFTSAPSSSSSDTIPAYGLQGTFGPTIAALVHTYNTAPPVDELTRAQTELSQVKDIMVQNVEQILSRGERIELLVDKTDVMAGQATAFRRGARSVSRQMWWKNTKVMALCVIVALVRLSNNLVFLYR